MAKTAKTADNGAKPPKGFGVWAREWAESWGKSLSLVGVLLYTFLWTATSAFYSRLGVDPQDIGVDYGSILVKSAGQIVLIVGAVLLYILGFAVYSRRRRSAGREDARMLPAFGPLALVVILWAVGLFSIAAIHANDVRKGIVVPTTFAFLPYVPWRVWPAEVSASAIDPPSIITDLAEDCVFYLGQGNGYSFFYDVDEKRSLHVPSSQVVVSTQSRGERPRCPE
jgi:hypothetical protein